MSAPAQKQFTVNGAEFVVQEWTTSQAIYWGKYLIDMGAGALDGVTGDTLAKANVNIGRLIAGIIKTLRPADTVTFLRGIVKDSVVKPTYSDEWFDNHFGPNLHWLIELVTEIVKFQFRDAAPALKKKVLPALLTLQ